MHNMQHLVLMPRATKPHTDFELYVARLIHTPCCTSFGHTLTLRKWLDLCQVTVHHDIEMKIKRLKQELLALMVREYPVHQSTD